MAQAQVHAKPVWHLSRGGEQPCLLSDRELLLLAELGHLRATDLLWRHGFDGWRTANSIPSLLIPPPLVVETKSDFAAASLAFARRFYEVYNRLARWRDEFRPLVRHWPSSQLYVLAIYRHVRGTKFDLRYTFAGLLVAVVCAGVLNLPQHSSFAAYNQAAPQDEVSLEPRHPKLKPTDANAVVLPHCQSQFVGPATDPTIDDDVHIFSVANLNELVVAPTPISEAQSTSVPLPTKKPASPIKRLSMAERARPKPMRFGVIGFNYSAP
jgi:hypothetical protein